MSRTSTCPDVVSKRFFTLLVLLPRRNPEQISLSKKVTGEKYKLLSENLEVGIKFLNEEPIMIELPINIECKIISTEGSIKGQTAASSYKPAVLDNGININVPPFIENNDKIILDTRTLEYVRKVK